MCRGDVDGCDRLYVRVQGWSRRVDLHPDVEPIALVDVLAAYRPDRDSRRHGPGMTHDAGQGRFHLEAERRVESQRVDVEGLLDQSHAGGVRRARQRGFHQPTPDAATLCPGIDADESHTVNRVPFVVKDAAHDAAVHLGGAAPHRVEAGNTRTTRLATSTVAKPDVKP